jgi:hypothetical protein
VDLVNDVYNWIDRVLLVAFLALRVWAFVDCIFRKARAFPAVNKLTKVTWLAILFVSGVVGSLPSLAYNTSSLNIISSASVVVALVYLCDVRPAVREVSGGGR